MLKDLNQVELRGMLKIRRVPTPDGGCHMEAYLSTSVREQDESGQWTTANSQWHHLIPVNKKAADSLRRFPSQASFARACGQYRRHIYEDKEGKRRHAHQILVFDPICPAEPGQCNKALIRGHLGADPHIAYPPDDGPAVVVLAVATNASKREPLSPDGWSKQTTWHKVIMRGEEAVEQVRELKKGCMVCGQGQLWYRKSRKGPDKIAEIFIQTLMTPTHKKAHMGATEELKARILDEEIAFSACKAFVKNSQQSLFAPPPRPVLSFNPL